MVLLALGGRQISRRRSFYLQILSRCFSNPPVGSGSSIPDQEVVTGSLSGVKYVSKLVPPNNNTTTSSNNKISTNTKHEARLLVSGPDATGIVASFSQLLYGHGCGIVDCTSESSEEDDHDTVVVKDDSVKLHHHHGRMFFQRILFDYSDICVQRSVVVNEIESMCLKFGWNVIW